MPTTPNGKLRRKTFTKRDGTRAPLPENLSLIDLQAGVAVALLKLDTGYQY